MMIMSKSFYITDYNIEKNLLLVDIVLYNLEMRNVVDIQCIGLQKREMVM